MRWICFLLYEIQGSGRFTPPAAPLAQMVVNWERVCGVKIENGC